MPPQETKKRTRKKKLNTRQLNKILAQAAQQSRQENLVEHEGTEPQKVFINDPARLKAALCTRRAGKTYGCGLYLIQEALTNPGSTSLFIGLTRESAKRIFIREVLQVLAEKHGLKGSFNNNALAYTLSNGSVIYIMGADATETQRDKLLGQTYQLVVIDESGSFRQDLEALVMDTLLPTTTGAIALIGTPKNTKGFFYRVTTGQVPGWSVHTWTWKDNPYWCAQTEAIIRMQVAANPLVVETPAFRQNFNAEWTIDDSALVYRFSAERNTIDELPKNNWLYIIGIDLGYTDSTAWVVCAYSLVGEKCLYIVDCLKKPKLELNLVAEETQRLIDAYGPIAVVVDFASRQSLETLKQHWGLPLEDAEKRDKVNAIHLMNADLIQGQVKVVTPLAIAHEHPLIEEWESLVWDEKRLARNVYTEHSGCDNHLTDAMLYAWRRSGHFNTQRASEVAPGRDTDEWASAYWKRVAARNEATANVPWWEKDNQEWIGTDGDGDDW